MFAKKLEQVFFYLLILFLPTQLGKHFWPDFAFVNGIRIDYLSPTLYVTDILVVTLFISWFLNRHSGLSRISYGSNETDSGVALLPRMTKEKKIYLIFCLFLLLNIFLSLDFFNGLYHLLKFFEFSFLAYYVASQTISLQQVKKIFFFLGIGVVGESLLAIAQFINQASIGGLLYFFGERTFSAMTPGIANASINGELVLRAYGTFSHPNVLAGYLLISMICLLFSLPWVHKGAEKAFWFTTLLLGSSALLLTMSRLVFILWVGILLVVFLQQLQRNIYKIFAAVIFLGLLGTIFAFTPFGARLLQTSLGEESVVQREVLIQASGTLFKQQPIIGIGLGNFIPKLATIQEPLSPVLYLQPVHNIFLMVLVETGIIGLLIFIWFLIKTYKELLSKIQKKTMAHPYRIFLIHLSAIVILGLFDHYWLTLQQGQLFFSLIIGLSWTKLRGE